MLPEPFSYFLARCPHCPPKTRATCRRRRRAWRLRRLPVGYGQDATPEPNGKSSFRTCFPLSLLRALTSRFAFGLCTNNHWFVRSITAPIAALSWARGWVGGFCVRALSLRVSPSPSLLCVLPSPSLLHHPLNNHHTTNLIITTIYFAKVGPDGKKLYSGMVDCIKKIVRNEGLGALYKG